ncbi:MAG TPA: DUF6675 family protein [Geminicoccaceae bacterium]|nr:DUF6675 family protein [Geminicoccaceae bacterium]
MARLAACCLAVGAVLWLAPGTGAATDGLRPPCGDAPSPAYADLGSVPAVRVWTAGELGAAGWDPPACTGWRPLPFRVLVAAAGRFRHEGGVEDLLARFGAVSALATVKYWSVSDGRWESLVTRAAALAGPDVDQRRPDFRPAEMAGGADLFFAQDDNRSTGEVVHRMRVREIGPARLVVEAENVGAVRYLLVPLAGPGDLQWVHFFERRSAAEWGYYGLARVGAGASSLLEGHRASYANRAVALFRHLAGLPTDQGPAAAP